MSDDLYEIRVRRSDDIKGHKFTVTGDTLTRMSHDPRFVILSFDQVESNVTDWSFFLTWRDVNLR